MPAYYCPDLKAASKRAVLTGEEFHHLSHVMRKQTGQTILLTNGQGLLARAIIVKLEKKNAIMDILSIEEKSFGRPRIGVAFSLLRNKHDHLIVEKLTELGFKEFFPYIGEFTVRKDTGNVIEKFEAVAISAIKQCDGAFLPRIHPVMDFQNVIARIREEGFRPLVACEWKQKANRYRLIDDDSDLCLVIGPEGGFSEDERTWIQEQKIETFSLGNHIVRAETAAIAAGGLLTGILLAKDPEFY